MSNPQIALWLPYAQQVSQATGVLPGVLLALGLEETGLGTAGTGVLNNVWGVKYVQGVSASGTTEQAGGFAAYPTGAVAAADMIRVLSLSDYAGVRAAVGATAQIEALAASPYDGATASARAGWAQVLLSVYASNGLAAYDGRTPVQQPQPAQFQVAATGSTLTVSAPSAIIGGGAAIGIVLLAAVALFLAEHL